MTSFWLAFLILSIFACIRELSRRDLPRLESKNILVFDLVTSWRNKKNIVKVRPCIVYLIIQCQCIERMVTYYFHMKIRLDLDLIKDHKLALIEAKRTDRLDAAQFQLFVFWTPMNYSLWLYEKVGLSSLATTREHVHHISYQI